MRAAMRREGRRRSHAGGVAVPVFRLPRADHACGPRRAQEPAWSASWSGTTGGRTCGPASRKSTSTNTRLASREATRPRSIAHWPPAGARWSSIGRTSSRSSRWRRCTSSARTSRRLVLRPSARWPSIRSTPMRVGILGLQIVHTRRVRARHRDRAPRDGTQCQPRGLDAFRSALGPLPQGRVRAGPRVREPGGRARTLLALPRHGVGLRSPRPARRSRGARSGICWRSILSLRRTRARTSRVGTSRAA